MSDSITLAAAFSAGLLSYFNPCSLVLMPGFLAYLTGMGLDSADSTAQRRYNPRVVIGTLGFILGFTVIFVLLGASLGLVSQVVQANQQWVNRIGGVAIIFFGLVALGMVRANFLDREYRFPVPKVANSGLVSSFLVGGAFGVGWTPCTGPILGAVLALAATSGSAGNGAVLLLAYTAGLMIPFALTGMFSSWAAQFIQVRHNLLRSFSSIAGVFLIVLGVMVFTNRFTQLTGYLFFLGQ
jgi:cytochrome c-type biogenesis protein